MMRIAGVVLSLLWLSSRATPGQDVIFFGSEQQGQTQQFKPAELCTVEGALVNSNNGEPVRKVQVSIYPAGGHGQQHTAITDTTGKFVLSEVEPGRYVMNAGGSGYPFQAYAQKTRGGYNKLISLEPGQHEKGIVFRLAPGAAISGAVYDDDGDPVVAANVQAYRSGRSGRNAGRNGPAGGGQTDDRGNYRIFGLDAGQYHLLAERQNQNDGSDDVYLPTYYPNTSDPAQSTPVQVRPGDELTGMNLNMTRGHGLRVRGQVIFSGGQKPQGVYIQLISAATKEFGYNNRNYGAAVQGENGEFEIRGVPPGSYNLIGGWNDGRKAYAGRVPVEVNAADLDGISLVLRSATNLQGRLRTDGDGPLDFSKLQVWLQPGDPSGMGGGGGAEIKADGSFVVRNLFDGNYHIRVSGYPEQYYVKSARLGGSDVPLAALVLGNGQSPGPLEIQLSLNGGSVSGTVLNDSQPAPGSLVVLVPDPPNRARDEMYSTKTTDQLGRFNMLGLPPGRFKLFAWEATEGIDFTDAEFLKQYEERGKSVTIEDKHSQSLELELIAIEEESK
jgi:hypothetical protein